jgi:hypothetical protein
MDYNYVESSLKGYILNSLLFIQESCTDDQINNVVTFLRDNYAKLKIVGMLFCEDKNIDYWCNFSCSNISFIVKCDGNCFKIKENVVFIYNGHIYNYVEMINKVHEIFNFNKIVTFVKIVNHIQNIIVTRCQNGDRINESIYVDVENNKFIWREI